MVNFANVYAYEKAKWRRKHLGEEPDTQKVEEAVQEVEHVEVEKPDYEAMSRSELFTIAKENGYDQPWIASTKEVLIEYLNG